MSYKTNKYEKPSFRNHKRKVDRVKKEVTGKWKETKKTCFQCHQRRISPYHHYLCSDCWNKRWGKKQ